VRKSWDPLGTLSSLLAGLVGVQADGQKSERGGEVGPKSTMVKQRDACTRSIPWQVNYFPEGGPTMNRQRGRKRIMALAVVLALTLGVGAPITKEAEAGNTFIPFLATGGGFTCGIFLVNFFAAPITFTVDSAVATRRVNTVATFPLGGFEGIQINCNALTGIGATTGVNFMSVFLSQPPSLPPQAFGFMFLPPELGGGVVVPPLLFLFT